MLEGVVNVLKPPGMSSSDVVTDIRHIFNMKRVGHTGTLDPGAAGVLPICIGRATRLFDYLVDKEKEYIGEITFGIATDTQDSYGAPEDSFTIIAGYWNVFLAAKLKALGIDVKDLLSPLDTTNMMVLFKQARKLGQKPSRDNYVDSCGYEAIGADRLSE